MEMIFTNLTIMSTRKQLVSDEVQLYLDIYFRIVVITAVGVFGVVANLISAAVFVRQGVSDCVSVCLLSLTSTNLAAAAFGLLTLFCKIVILMNVLTDFDPLAVYYTLPHVSAKFYNISTITTAFISLERCLCVTWPLKFSNAITFRKAVIVLMGIYLYEIIASLPDQLTMRLMRQFDPKINRTRTVLWLSPSRPQVDIFNRMFNQFTVESLCLIILIISTYSMVKGLRRSLHRWADHLQVQKNDGIVPVVDPKRPAKEHNQVIVKRKVVKTVVTLAIVAFSCNSLRLLLAIIDHAHPDLVTSEFNLYVDLIGASFLLQTVNASVDIFVYLSYNISFRRCFIGMFCRSCMHL